MRKRDLAFGSTARQRPLVAHSLDVAPFQPPKHLGRFEGRGERLRFQQAGFWWPAGICTIRVEAPLA
jgi:hypothetical protein